MRMPNGTEGRFSRGNLTTLIVAKIDDLRETYGFDPGNGYAQLPGRSLRRGGQVGLFSAEDLAIHRAYGEYMALRNLLDRIWE